MSTICIDSRVFIIASKVRGSDVNPARRLLEQLRKRARSAATSELPIAELLAPTSRRQAMPTSMRRRLHMRVLDDGFLDLVLESASLRERFPRRLPDAIHMANAITLSHRFFVPFDRDGRRLPEGLSSVTPGGESVDRLLGALDA